MSVGRPAKFDNAEEMQESIDSFFANPPTRTVVAGGESYEMPAVTITGLAIHLGFESRQSIYDYAKDERFSYTIKRALMMVENAYEQNLQSPNCTGSIFALKNMGWKDKQELEHSEKITDSGENEW